jgi:hypothetical protein
MLGRTPIKDAGLAQSYTSVSPVETTPGGVPVETTTQSVIGSAQAVPQTVIRSAQVDPESAINSNIAVMLQIVGWRLDQMENFMRNRCDLDEVIFHGLKDLVAFLQTPSISPEDNKIRLHHVIHAYNKSAALLQIVQKMENRTSDKHHALENPVAILHTPSLPLAPQDPVKNTVVIVQEQVQETLVTKKVSAETTAIDTTINRNVESSNERFNAAKVTAPDMLGQFQFKQEQERAACQALVAAAVLQILYVLISIASREGRGSEGRNVTAVSPRQVYDPGGHCRIFGQCRTRSVVT